MYTVRNAFGTEHPKVGFGDREGMHSNIDRPRCRKSKGVTRSRTPAGQSPMLTVHILWRTTGIHSASDSSLLESRQSKFAKPPLSVQVMRGSEAVRPCRYLEYTATERRRGLRPASLCGASASVSCATHLLRYLVTSTIMVALFGRKYCLCCISAHGC